MKKIVLGFILFLSFIMNCHADLTDEQSEEVASFAANLILESMKAPHLDKYGFPLIAYNMGQYERIDGMNGKLTYFNKDVNEVNTINGNKWAFDCSSFASYVYYHTLGVNTFYDDGYRPYTVHKFVEDANANKSFYNIIKEIKTDNLDLNLLKKGDLVIIVGEHIMVYVGNGQIAHVSVSAVKKGSNLGAEVTNLKAKYPGRRVRIIRIKNGLIPTNKKPNTIVTWPDTKASQDIGAIDLLPEVNVNYNPNITNQLNLELKFSDDKGLTGYSIETSQVIPSKWTVINKQKSFNTSYQVLENGTYYIYVKDSKNQVSYKEVNISNIDNIKPVIEKIECKQQDNGTFSLIINAIDTNKISYSLDGNFYQDSNNFINISNKNYILYAKDIAGNISTSNIDLSSSNLPNISISYDSNYTKEVMLNINVTSPSTLVGYNVTMSSYEPTEYFSLSNSINYQITKNGTYYIWVKSISNVSVFKKVVINNIDNTPPVITNVKIVGESINTYDLKISAYDMGCGISGYSINGTDYYESNILSNVDNRIKKVYVKDKCNNVISTSFNLESSNNTLIIIVILVIIVVFVVGGILINNYKNKRKLYW